MSNGRRFEVMLPLQFNDGRSIPQEWIGEAMSEVTDHFGFSSFETQIIEGRWLHGATLYQDELMRLFVDVPATVKNRRWMKAFKKRWKEKLEQLELWMVSYRIEIE